MSSEKLKILHLIETTGPGGAETVMLNIVSRLDSSLFQSLVIVTGRGWLYDSLTNAGVQTMIIESQGANDWRFVRRVVGLIREKNIDVIHSHLNGMNFYACLAGVVSSRPVVTTFHGVIGDWNHKTVKNRLKYALIRSASRCIVTVSEFLKHQLAQTWAFPHSKMTRIYNGVDFDMLDRMVASGDLRTSLNIPVGVPVIGMVGNIRATKGYDHYVRAARLVVDKRPDCRFLIVGQGSGKLLEQITSLIKELHVEERMILTGFRDDIPNVLKQLDIFVLASTSEGLSIATIEAMGVGKPVVVTDSGGPSEIVKNGETGFVVPPGDAEAMAQRIVKLLDDGPLAAKFGERGRDDVRSRFTIEQNVQSYAGLYQGCLERRVQSN